MYRHNRSGQNFLESEIYKMNATSKNKQLAYLFLCNFAILFVGFGLFPVLPLYATEYGANSSMTGIYMAITYISITIGSILTGRLAEYLPRKFFFSVAGLLGIPSLILLGQATSLWQVVFLTGAVWFAGGVGLSTTNVISGFHTTPSTRGKIFGLTSVASSMGAVIGGMVVGQLVRLYGYPTMFTAAALVWSIWPILALWKIDYRSSSATITKNNPAKGLVLRYDSLFLSLIATVLLASMTVSVARLGLSLSMKASQFSASDISAANALGGLIALPVTLMTGVLSDRLGRKTSLIFGYLIAAASTLMLLIAREMWQFQVASSFVLISRNIISPMSSAFATDLLERDQLGRALPLVNSANWVSGVLGFLGTGYVMDLFGAATLYDTASIIALLAVVIAITLPASLSQTRTRMVMDVAKK